MKNAPLPTLNEIVFENRNKEYGAYDLRMNYGKHLTKGFIFTLISITLIFGFLWIFRNKVDLIIDQVRTEVIVDFENFIIPKKEIIQKSVPIKTISYVPPKIVIDTEQIEEYTVPKTNELNSAVIGTTTIAGEVYDGLIEPETTKEPIFETKVGTPSKEPILEDNSVLLSAEIMPEYAGGMREFVKYLQKNVNYPNPAMRAGVEGRVFLQFIVSKTGKISDVVVLKGIGFGCDEEALRVILNMPNWKPGFQNKIPVNVKFTLPVSFTLE